MRRKDSIKSLKCEQSLKSFASTVFQECSVGVISNIVQVPSRKRKLLKIFFLAMSMTGFLYQSGLFVSSYLEYPTILYVSIKLEDRIMVPAYTFCSNNG